MHHLYFSLVRATGRSAASLSAHRLITLLCALFSIFSTFNRLFLLFLGHTFFANVPWFRPCFHLSSREFASFQSYSGQFPSRVFFLFSFQLSSFPQTFVLPSCLFVGFFQHFPCVWTRWTPTMAFIFYFHFFSCSARLLTEERKQTTYLFSLIFSFSLRHVLQFRFVPLQAPRSVQLSHTML